MSVLKLMGIESLQEDVERLRNKEQPGAEDLEETYSVILRKMKWNNKQKPTEHRLGIWLVHSIHRADCRIIATALEKLYF